MAMAFICCALALLAAISLASASALDFEHSVQRSSSDCDMEPEVAYCLHVMRVGSQDNEEINAHFERLNEHLERWARNECPWDSTEGGTSAEECVGTLSRFAEDNAASSMSTDVDVPFVERSRKDKCLKRCRRPCFNSCRSKYRGKHDKKYRRCRKKCRSKCHKKCAKKY